MRSAARDGAGECGPAAAAFADLVWAMGCGEAGVDSTVQYRPVNWVVSVDLVIS